MAIRFSRRRFLAHSAAAGASFLAMPYLSRAADRPVVSHGVQSGDVGTSSGMIWSRADRPAQMMVEVATTESFSNARMLPPCSGAARERFHGEAAAR
jgi:alkaline phosphatase D